MVSSSTLTSTTITYSKTTTTTIKKAREGTIVSPVNFTVRNNAHGNQQQSENDYKNINDLVEYINSENGKSKKNKKKKNLSKKKKINKKREKNENLQKNSTSKSKTINKVSVSENDSEVEEFRKKIMNQSVKANLVQKIKPRFSDTWLKLLKNTLDC